MRNTTNTRAGKGDRAHGTSSSGPGRVRSSFPAPGPTTNAVTFAALLRRIDIKALRSGDKGIAVTFEVDNPGDTLVDELNRLMRADDLVSVGVWR
jgi:hypothetical protein